MAKHVGAANDIRLTVRLNYVPRGLGVKESADDIHSVVLGQRGDIRTQETNLGDLIADALLAKARQAGGEFGIDKVDIGLQNGGGIRNDSVLPPGEISELDTFDVLPFSNFVTVVEDIEPARLKLIMENAVAALEDVGGAFAQIAGFSLVYDPSAQKLELDDAGAVVTEGQRVKELALDDGTKLVENGAVVQRGKRKFVRLVVGS